MRTSDMGSDRALRAVDGADGAAAGDDARRVRGEVPRLGRGAVRDGDAGAAGRAVAADSGDEAAGPVRGRGQRASGRGGADGDAERALRGGDGVRGPGFDRVVPPGGYGWWYLDALSDDVDGHIKIATDFQIQPNDVPIPVGEQPAALAALQAQVNVQLQIDGVTFNVVVAGGDNTEYWVIDNNPASSTFGIWVAEVPASQIMNAGNPAGA